MSYNEYKKLKKGNYEVFIDSSFKKGYLNIGEIILKGKSKEEVFYQHIFVIHQWRITNYLDQ